MKSIEHAELREEIQTHRILETSGETKRITENVLFVYDETNLKFERNIFFS